MADFFFFTEPNKLQDQTSEQAFGAIDENKYRLGNMFTATANSKAFAVTSGNVLVQAIDSNTITLVLKPEEQPNLDFPKIDYIIYKGLLKTSLIDGEKVATPSNNDLTRKIWESHTDLLAEMPDAPSEPQADVALGFGYSTTGADSYQVQDTDPLSKAFYDDDNRMFRVKSGDYIGDFNASGLGILIVFEKIGFDPTFKLARELDSKLTFTNLDAEPTSAEKFRRKHEKEAVLAYLDSTAFFSAFDGANLKVTTNGTDFEEKSPEDFYNLVTTKHINKNILYLDIRNENLDSFNYYENYENLIKWDITGNDTYTEQDYYRNKWPLLALKDNEFNTTNTNRTIGVALNAGDNEFPLVFLKKGKLTDVEITEENPSSRFLDIEMDEQRVNYKLLSKIQVPTNNSGNIKSNYFQLRYIKKYATPDSPYRGLSLKNESYLDNMFPIFDMKLPYVKQGSVDVKLFTDAYYVDKTNINEIDFTVNLGIAKDSESINFIAFPEIYNQNEVNKRNKVPLYSQQAFDGLNFIDFFNKTIGNETIVKETFQLADGQLQYLSFDLANNVFDENSNDPMVEEDTRALNFNPPPISGNYDLENTIIMTLTLEQFEELKTVAEQEFPNPYKVYLGVTNTNYLTESDDAAATTVFCLRGLEETEEGLMNTREYVTSIEVFIEEDIFNWEQSLSNPTNLDEEENFHLSSIIGEYEFVHDPNDNPQAPQSTYMNLYENIGEDLKNIVDDFNNSITQLTDVDFIDNITSIIIDKGSNLFQTAKANIKNSSHIMYGKDGSLYLARLQMRKALKLCPEAKKVDGNVFEEYINLIEKVTRGLHSSNRPDFSSHPAHIPILITGYDPFRGAFIPAGRNIVYGIDKDYHLTNASGHLALALDNEVLSDGSNDSIIKSAIFPVRFKEFDNGWIEDFFEPYINPNHPNYQEVKMIITFSYFAESDNFEIERFASRFRKIGTPDNIRKLSTESSYLNNSDKDNFEFIETTLLSKNNDGTLYINLDDSLYKANEIELDQSANFQYYEGNRLLYAYDNSSISSFDISQVLPFPNIANYPPPTGGVLEDADNIKAVKGSGGDYLSNEIFYRVAFLREKYNSNLKTGHIHLNFHKGDANENREDMLTMIEDAIKRTLSNL